MFKATQILCGERMSQVQVPQLGTLGIVPKIRAKIMRIRAVVPESIYSDQAARVDVQIGGTSLTREYFGQYYVNTTYKEIWVFKQNGEIKAFMTIYKDETTGEFVFGVSRMAWDAMDVLFDGALVGTSPTFPAVSADMTPSVGYVTFRGAPPA